MPAHAKQHARISQVARNRERAREEKEQRDIESRILDKQGAKTFDPKMVSKAAPAKPVAVHDEEEDDDEEDEE